MPSLNINSRNSKAEMSGEGKRSRGQREVISLLSDDEREIINLISDDESEAQRPAKKHQLKANNKSTTARAPARRKSPPAHRSKPTERATTRRTRLASFASGSDSDARESPYTQQPAAAAAAADNYQARRTMMRRGLEAVWALIDGEDDRRGVAEMRRDIAAAKAARERAARGLRR